MAALQTYYILKRWEALEWKQFNLAKCNQLWICI